jgi:MFS family permease
MEKPRNFAGFALYKGLGKNIYTLFAVRIINRFGDFVQMLLVLILTGKLGMDSGRTGVFLTFVMVFALLGQLLGGSVADRLPRKYVLAFCQTLVSVCYLACALVSGTRYEMAVPFLILFGSPFRGATGPVSNTLVADFASDEDRGKAFSLLYLGTNIGVALGPMAAAFLYARSLPLLFGISSLLIAVSTALLLANVPKIETAVFLVKSDKEREGFARTLAMHPNIILFLVLFSFYSLAYGQGTFALPLQSTFLFGTAAGAVRYGYLMTANAVTVLLLTPAITGLTGHRHQLSNISLAMGFFMLGFCCFAFCSEFLPFLLATVVWTVGEILVATNANVYINAFAPPRYRGRFNALVITAGGVGASAGPLVGGFLIAGAGYRALWLVMAGICLVLLFSFVLMRMRFDGKN